MSCARAILLAILILTGQHLAVNAIYQVCSSVDKQFSNPTHKAIACYAGTFIAKVLTGINAGQAMTQQHARWQLLPYLGGVQGGFHFCKCVSLGVC